MSHLEQIAVRLQELSELLRDPSLEDGRAEQLAREAGELAAEAGAEVDRRLGEAVTGEAAPPEAEGEPAAGDE